MNKFVNDTKANFLNKIYSLINKQRKKYGDYKKCEFHIHTPASKCYRFIECECPEDEMEELESRYIYQKLSLEEVLDYSKKCGYLTDNMYELVKNKINEYIGVEYVQLLNSKKIPYDSFKEYITYMTIAHKLYQEKIEIAVISDHNTVKGYHKLIYALEEYYKTRCTKETPRVELLLGVEISCSDKNHLVVIYDSDEYDTLKMYLKEIIMDEELGTYYDTRKIIEDMQERNALSYIAHINSSSLYGSGVYKKALFNSVGLKGFGVSNIGTILREQQRIKSFRENIEGLSVIYEGDSHSINQIGKKNSWIKFSKANFKAMKKAFLNHEVCICNSKPIKTSKYIKGVVVDTGEYGFLKDNTVSNDKSNNQRLLVLDFSSDLNCIIGGRGTGKSTILNMLEIIFSQQSDDIDILDFISQHRSIYSVFSIDEEEYILEFIPQTYFPDYNDYPVLYKNSYSEVITNKGHLYYKLKSDWYRVYKVVKGVRKNKYMLVDERDIPYLLKSIFRRGYNINKLVNKISNNDVSEYIKDVVTYGVKYEDINNYIRVLKETNNAQFQKYLRENLNLIISMIEDRKKQFGNIIDAFNKANDGVLIIEYKPISDIGQYFECFLDIFNGYNSADKRMNSKTIRETHVERTCLTWENVQGYFSQLIKKINYFELLDIILNKRFKALDKVLSIKDFQYSPAFKDIEIGLNEITNENLMDIYKSIFNRIKENRELLEESIIKCFKVLDEFDIKFNINNREDVNNVPKNLKSLKNLSLGQRVAALLTFVFKFGIVAEDNTPLLIDQPEDNLDNTYIYKTLVESLKSIKNSRQVIVVTHSSTIVTNANAEEVIVMKSNEKNGWIEKKGYPSEDIIIKHIINYLEGGKESFRHKIDMYSTVIS